MTHLINEKHWLDTQLLKAIDLFDLKELESFIIKLLTNGIFIEVLSYGNISIKVELLFTQADI